MSDTTTETLRPPKLTRYQLPGFGLPLNFKPHVEYTSYDSFNIKTRTGFVYPTQGDCGPLYPNALDSDATQMRLTSLREFTMMRLMNQLTDKPDWNTKIFDQTIIARWKTEAISVPDIDITESMVAWCIDELQYKAEKFEETGIISAYDGDIVKSDTVIPPSLRNDLKVAVAPLEDVPEVYRDWHPGSGNTVLDLVHPSLFPVIYGRTKILKDTLVGLDDCVGRCGDGVTLGVPPSEEALQYRPNLWGRVIFQNNLQDPYSRKYQWLPCEVVFEGDRVKITSYINNLHPKVHKSLYEAIERVIEIAIPLWNQTLTPLKFLDYNSPRIDYGGCIYDPDPENWPEEDQLQQLPNETEDDYLERKDEWARDMRRVVRPEPEKFAFPRWNLNEDGEEINKDKRVDLKKEFSERGLQIIVKLANIHLTPEKPNYAGGTWHVEGQLNEHICATALYYYDSVNITESHLSFRQQSSSHTMDIGYDQDHHDWLPEVFGCEQNGPNVQYVGDVATREGRLLTFPNVFQHRVLPFRLIDPTKLGHRKILALFLVDPHIRIISSANVPCQQREWWAQEIKKQGLLGTVPAEIQNDIIRNVVEFPIGIEEGKELRLELMEERKVFVHRRDQTFASETFSLCEH